MKSALKKNWHKIVSVVCVLAIASLCLISGTSSFAADDWSALGDDAVALKDAYLRYLNGWLSGDANDILGSYIDVPVSWFKILSDGTKAISPIDDWYYYLTEGDEHGGGGGRVRSGGHGSEGGRVHLAEDVAPVLPSDTLKQAASYWADYYKPMPTTTQYTWSYQSTGSTKPYPYSIDTFAPIYMSSNGSWGKKNWASVYVLPFVILDGTYYYSCQYYKFYSTKDEDNNVSLIIDYISLDDSSLKNTQSLAWDAATYPFIALISDSSNQYYNENHLFSYRSYSDYMSDSNRTYFNGSSNVVKPYIANLVSIDYSSNVEFRTLSQSVSFNPQQDSSDDLGYFLSSEPFQLFLNQTSIDFEQIPDNYVITINGDTIYDYSITNPDTGETSTINEYVTNNYTYITNNNGDDSGGSGSSGGSSGGGSVSGNVDVSGNVNVSGQIDIKADPIDININTQPIDINVNVSGSGSSGSGSSEAAGVQFDEDVSLNNYYDWMNEQTSGFSGFMSKFFSWLPPEIVAMLCAGFACVILARFLGR